MELCAPPSILRRRSEHERTSSSSLRYDELSPERALRSLYAQDALIELVKAVTGANRVFRLADPLGAASVNIFKKSWEHAWHFDEAEFTVTLSLQRAEAGGDFECTEPLRASEDDLAFDAAAAVINEHSRYSAQPFRDAALPKVRATHYEPGTLQIFNGRCSMHRVSPVVGATTRLSAVFCYNSQPGFVNSPETQELFWGRALQPEQQQ